MLSIWMSELTEEGEQGHSRDLSSPWLLSEVEIGGKESTGRHVGSKGCLQASGFDGLAGSMKHAIKAQNENVHDGD